MNEFVIKYINNNEYKRYKIRNDYYNYVRDLKGNISNKKYLYLEIKRYNGLDEYFKYYPEDIPLFESYRIELYNMTHNLFNSYQDCFVEKIMKEKEKSILKILILNTDPYVLNYIIFIKMIK